MTKNKAKVRVCLCVKLFKSVCNNVNKEVQSNRLTSLFGSFTAGTVVLGAPIMADQEDTFGLQNSPSGSDSRELQNDNKSEKQNGTSSKSPSSQTTYIQQVSIGQSVGLNVTVPRCEPRLLSRTYEVTFTVKEKRKEKENVYTY